MELEGKIFEVLPVRSGTSAKGHWMSQDFVLEHGTEQWRKKMLFTVFGEDRIKRFAIQKGQRVNVSFDIDAREWEGKWFSEIRAFDVRQRGESPVADATGTGAAPADNPFGDSMS